MPSNWRLPPARAGAGCVFVPLAVVAAALTLACAGSGVNRFTAAVAGLHDTLSSTPQGSEASVIYPVSIGTVATLVFVPAAGRADAVSLLAGGVAPELARRIGAELEGLGARRRPTLVVVESGRLVFSTAFADFADVTDVVSGSCRGRCRITLRAAGSGVRPRVVKVG